MGLKITDKKTKEYQYLKNMDKKNVDVYAGLFSDENEESARKGIFNEFGLDCPSRPFVEPTFMSKLPTIEKNTKNFFNKLNGDLGVLGENLGVFMKDEIKNTIDNMKTPKLSQKTIDKKGHDTLLKDTEEMYNSINYRVMKK